MRAAARLDGGVYGFKYVNGHPKNIAEGLQTVTAFGLLAEVATGYPVLLAEMARLIALSAASSRGSTSCHDSEYLFSAENQALLSGHDGRYNG